jgi:hypothetical protein
LRAGEGSILAVMVNHLHYLLPLQLSPYLPVPRPIARITTWCHNALVGRIYPQESPAPATFDAPAKRREPVRPPRCLIL